jgi:pyridoxal phosphate enzyme (YggS family)
MSPDSIIPERLAEVRAQIAEACRASGRDPATVTLVAVSKTVEAARCAQAVAAGQPLLGENYAQELRDKAPLVPGARWHFIGPLQRNKVKYAVGTAELIHSVDSRALAEEIARQAEKRGLVQRCLVQVNVAGEAQKSGCAPSELPSLLAAFGAHARCDGLMTIPPLEGDPRPHFRALAALARSHELRELSMGMSADFAIAIAEGATLVRIGTAIFGARPAH